MASYHFSASVIGRSDGRSAVVAAAYRACARLARAETGDVHDYRAKGGLAAQGILAPENAPAWASDREALWNGVEAIERRSNSQLARELRLALPVELTPEAHLALLREWLAAQVVERGMVADFAIHDPAPAPGRSRNPHAHVLLTMRRLDGDGWARTREREWNDRGLLEGWRASWANAQNAALAQAGTEARVDHRTLEAQQDAAIERRAWSEAAVLDRPPEPRLGVRAAALERDKPGSTERGQALSQAREDRTRLVKAAADLVAAQATVDELAREVEAESLAAAAQAQEAAQEAQNEEDSALAYDRTRTAVERQLRGMGLARVEVSVIGGERDHVRVMTPAQVVADLPRLRRANAAGCSILVRGPRDEDHDLVLLDLDDSGRGITERMKNAGHAPAVLVQTSPDSLQAWVRLGEPTPAPVRHEVARELARLYGADPGAVDPHQSGRLAGFTNPKPEHRTRHGAPFVLLHTFAGKVAMAARALLEAARSAVTVRPDARPVEPAPTASKELVAWWLRSQEAAPLPRDLSAVDWRLTHLALDAGHEPDEVSAALAETADRKGKSASAYAARTVGKAVAERAKPDEDSPSPT